MKGTTLDRFNRDKEPVVLTLVEPVTVEVSADTAWSGSSFRHPLRVLRARPELSPRDQRPALLRRALPHRVRLPFNATWGTMNPCAADT